MQRLYRILVSCFAVGLLAVFSLGAANTGARFSDLSGKLMCTCGCGQTLGTCNHLGCSSLARENGELHAAINHGDSDNAILIAFQNEYGPTVLSAPMFTRFNMIAWIAPPAFLLIGLLLAIYLVRKWRQRAAAMPAPVRSPVFQAMRDKIHKETQL